MPITHIKVSAKSDGADATLIQPSDWNAAHSLPDYTELANGWQYDVLAADFTTSSATAVDVTGISFTPIANAKYEFESKMMVRTATALTGPRPGIAWSTGLSDGVATIWVTSSASAQVMANGNITAAVLAPVGGLPTTTGSFPAFIEGLAVAGASPSGTIRLQLASETAGTNVTIKAGSFLRWRQVA